VAKPRFQVKLQDIHNGFLIVHNQNGFTQDGTFLSSVWGGGHRADTELIPASAGGRPGREKPSPFQVF
jgi:hypothetical protein